MIGEGTRRPTMFYNGATQDAAWRIGWVIFDQRLTRIIDRCEEPLIVLEPSLNDSASDIAFAASAVKMDDHILLYFSQSDQDLRRAVLRAT